jgi:hypothetical protein
LDEGWAGTSWAAAWAVEWRMIRSGEQAHGVDCFLRYGLHSAVHPKAGVYME